MKLGKYLVLAGIGLAVAAGSALNLQGGNGGREKSDSQGVVTWPAPLEEKLFEDYTLRVNGQAVPVYVCRVSAMPFNQVWPGYQRPLDQTELAGFAYWGMSGPVRRGSDFEAALQVGGGAAQFAGHPAGRRGPAHHLRAFAARASYRGAGRPASCPAPVRGPAGERGSQDRATRTCSISARACTGPGKILLKSGQTVYVAGGAVVYTAIEGRGVHGGAHSRARHHRHQRIRARRRAAAPFISRTART